MRETTLGKPKEVDDISECRPMVCSGDDGCVGESAMDMINPGKQPLV